MLRGKKLNFYVFGGSNLYGLSRNKAGSVIKILCIYKCLNATVVRIMLC